MLRLTEEQKKQRRKETQHRYHLKRNGRPVPPLTPLIRPIDTSLSQAQQSRKKSQRRYYVKTIMKPGAPSATPSEREIVEARLNREAQARMTPPTERHFQARLTPPVVRQETEATPMPVEKPSGQRLGTTPRRQESPFELYAAMINRAYNFSEGTLSVTQTFFKDGKDTVDAQIELAKQGWSEVEKFRQAANLGGNVVGGQQLEAAASTGDERRGGRR